MESGLKLASCPFCGGPAEIWRAHPENPPRKAWIACMGRCAVMTKEHDADEDAVTAWNTRALPPSSAPLLEALEDLLDAFNSFAKEANWGASCLSAETIRKVNEAPGVARAALAAAKVQQP